jgi:hypothetical protein
MYPYTCLTEFKCCQYIHYILLATCVIIIYIYIYLYIYTHIRISFKKSPGFAATPLIYEFIPEIKAVHNEIYIDIRRHLRVSVRKNDPKT